MDPVLRTRLTLSCHDAVIRFFGALDDGRLDDVAGAIAEDGVWHRQGKALRGPGEVAQALAARPAGRVTAHLVQNLVVDLDDDHNARVRYLVLTYRHDFPDGSGHAGDTGSAGAVGAAGTAGSAGGTGAAIPAPLGAPYSIAAYEDRLRASGTRWLVVERRSRNLFING